MSPTSSSNPFAGRKTRSAALRTNFSSSLQFRGPAEGAKVMARPYAAQTGTVAAYLRKRARITTSTRRPRSRFRPTITPS